MKTAFWILMLGVISLSSCHSASVGSNSITAQSVAELSQVKCQITPSEHWVQVPSKNPRVWQQWIENYDRLQAQQRSMLTIYYPEISTLAHAEENAQQRGQVYSTAEGFERVRNKSMRDDGASMHVLRYQPRKNEVGVLHYDFVLPVGIDFVVQAEANSPITYIDVLETPHREFGMHEKDIIAMVRSIQCQGGAKR